MRIKPTANTCITKNGNKYIYTYIFIKSLNNLKHFYVFLVTKTAKWLLTLLPIPFKKEKKVHG